MKKESDTWRNDSKGVDVSGNFSDGFTLSHVL